jgi:hypothetical protein
MKTKICVILTAFLLLSGCLSTLVEKSGEALDGNILPEKILEFYRTPGNDETKPMEIRRVLIAGEAEELKIESAAFPGLRLRTGLPAEDGGIEFTSLEFLSSHLNGWNEFSLELLGRGSFVVDGNKAFLRFEETPERVQISAGRIRLKQSRFTGDEALRSLRNRRERILALTEWTQSRENVPAFADQAAFERYWKPFLFPELASKKEAPPEWRAENDAFVKADSVNWNRSYTERIFPEELWEFRNSGALLRDWEEAAPWIYLEYAWDSIIASLNETELEKIK